MYGLIGPDAAGKSSIMKAIAGVLSYEQGCVEVFGTPIQSERQAEGIKARIGFLPQGLGQNLYPDLSVEENIDFFARLRLVSERDLLLRKRRFLAMTRLGPFRHRSMKHLSGGMKQKLGLVCTLIHEPELIILDEPTTGVDPVSRRDFWTILSDLVQERGLTALVSTSYMDEAARFQRLSLMFQGRVLASGIPSEILAQAPGVLVTVQADPQVEAMSKLKRTFSQVDAMGPSLHVFVEDEEAEVAQSMVKNALQNVVVKNLRATAPELEDVFVALLRRQQLVRETGPMPRSAFAGSSQNGGVAIEARGLIRQFGDFRAVDKVSFQIKVGEIFGLLGSNGAGKTTVIKMLTGILQPTGGEGWVAGVNMYRAAGALKERIGYVSQSFSLYLDLTVLENIRLFAGVYGLGDREGKMRLDWIVTMAGLGGFEQTLAGQLPMGVRQRLALGCALVHRPQVLFLDEPTSGVDPVGRRRFWEILLHLAREEGVALLVTTHYMGEAEHCDRLALMDGGRIVSEGSPSHLKEEVEREAGELLELMTTHPVATVSFLQQAGFHHVGLVGSNIHVLSDDPKRDTQRMREVCDAHGILLQRVSPRPLTLEDVFVYRMKKMEQEDSGRAVGGSS
ncbi:MAG: ATP-binding cassette domain-containing protein [Nitrospirales bacterium]|nr:ATP-binding cassette domain-containing protein [Nitrospirales bacterium]